MTDSIPKTERQVIACTRCPRLVEYRERVAREKRRAYRDWEYWGKPVPGFGDPRARLLVVGLAPAAHGGNRTGRVFTGDSSGDLLFGTLYRTGFASQPNSVSRDDGMRLQGAFITAAARCAPPANKPKPDEFRNCREYLERELDALEDLKVVVALGKIAFDAYLSILLDRKLISSRSHFPFSHGAVHQFPPPPPPAKPRPVRLPSLAPQKTGHVLGIPPLPTLIGCYHPSRQNTQTGKLSVEMFESVFRKARSLC